MVGEGSLFDKAYKTAPIITMVAVIVFGIIFIIFQYRKNLLDARLAAMQIKQIQKNTGIAPDSHIVDEVLKGDIVNDLSNKIGI